MPILLTALWACTTSAPPCEATPPGLDRDRCVVERSRGLDVSQVERVVAAAASVQDPVYRSVLVKGWVSDHRTQISPTQARSLCEQLQGEEATHCLQLYSLAHL